MKRLLAILLCAATLLPAQASANPGQAPACAPEGKLVRCIREIDQKIIYYSNHERLLGEDLDGARVVAGASSFLGVASVALLAKVGALFVAGSTVLLGTTEVTAGLALHDAAVIGGSMALLLDEDMTPSPVYPGGRNLDVLVMGFEKAHEGVTKDANLAIDRIESEWELTDLFGFDQLAIIGIARDAARLHLGLYQFEKEEILRDIERCHRAKDEEVATRRDARPSELTGPLSDALELVDGAADVARAAR